MCVGGFSGHKSSNRIELSWFIQDLLYFFWFGFHQLLGVGQMGGGYLGWPTIVNMSSGVFRGKESSSRIELSWLVQYLFWCFGLPAALGGRGVGWWGGAPYMCTHANIHVKHDNLTCQWQPPLGESMGIPYDVIHKLVHVSACMHVCTCSCVYRVPPPPHTPSTHPPTPMGTPRISKSSIRFELIKIFQFC